MGGHGIPDSEYESYKEFAESERYSADFDQTSHVRVMTRELMDTLQEGLAGRQWSLGVAMDDAPDFICSDAPVAVWPAKGADLGKPITFTSPETVLSMPITRRLVTISRYESRGPVQVVTREGVLIINTWTLSNATRAYSSSPEFILHAARNETSSNSWKLSVISDTSFSACVVRTRSNTP